MNILDIAIAKKLAGGGGGSGTDNYNDLSNLPKINDTTLSGNKTSANLGLQSEINSDSKLASDLVDDTNQDNKFVTSSEKSTWNGKQNAIDADHKINADYVDDSTSTNKFVTATDKETWNAKQNAIDSSHKLSSDLVDDTNHTNKFVTSTEKQTWNGKQNAIDSDHKLSSSLVSFTTAEAAALASGIDSTKVGQISTNQTNILLMMNGVNHNMIYRGQNLGATLTDAQHTALSSGNFTDLYLGDYWTKSVTIPAGTYTGGDGEEVTVAEQTVTLKAVIADFDTFYAGYASGYAAINTHHAGVIVTGFNNVVWNKTNSTAGGYVASLIHKWLVGSVLPQLESWFGSAKVLSHQKVLSNAITGDAVSGWAWSSQKISLLSECQLFGMKLLGGSKATNGADEPFEAFKKLNVFNHIDANLLFGNNNIWCRDIVSALWVANLNDIGNASHHDASYAWIAPAALILLS